jgi:hypothetical protein
MTGLRAEYRFCCFTPINERLTDHPPKTLERRKRSSLAYSKQKKTAGSFLDLSGNRPVAPSRFCNFKIKSRVFADIVDFSFSGMSIALV